MTGQSTDPDQHRRAVADLYRHRADAFEATVRGVPDWSRASPCAGWDARDVLRHVVDMHRVMLRPYGTEPAAAPTVDDDPLGALLAARAEVTALLEHPVLAARVTESPAGTMPGADMVDAVASTDLVWHRWDLVRATGYSLTDLSGQYT